jgi:hypothetical protein
VAALGTGVALELPLMRLQVENMMLFAGVDVAEFHPVVM